MAVVDTLKKLLFRSELERLARRERDLNTEVNQRVAAAVSKIDPIELLMKDFHGIFSKTHERVEDPLDDPGQLMMQIWGWQNATSPAFERMTEWIMNTQGNETLKKAAVTPERILYGRAQISGVLLFVREVKRLSEAYKERLAQGKGEGFDESIPVD